MKHILEDKCINGLFFLCNLYTLCMQLRISMYIYLCRYAGTSMALHHTVMQYIHVLTNLPHRPRVRASNKERVRVSIRYFMSAIRISCVCQ